MIGVLRCQGENIFCESAGRSGEWIAVKNTLREIVTASTARALGGH